ncbi:MAG TPA: cytochrome b N-terminal domain-containing protein [Candidatus Baltobacteraceae bacterium]|nr:cytochrome b N-terminal domain-containing protein [Candidatus Baltobacteraceae bacterium]
MNNPLLNWIEQRTGLVSVTTDFLTEDVPGGASYWYVFGSATLFAMILQIVTGIFLTFYYAPSVASAWESTKYIYEHVPFGSFVISLHFWGATAMIALVFMHLLQVLIWGAYKAPREMAWVVGVLLLVFTLVLGLTGYLLPWDLNAYFASAVAINIAASVPVIGTFIYQFLNGNATLGTLTINRFFGLHVWAMPALLVLLVVLHLMIFRHNGGAGPATDVEQKKLPQGRFWPNQMFMDAVASFVVFAIIVALAIFSPAPLDEKADPTNSSFVPFPAWYFLGLYGLLRVAALLPHEISGLANLLATVVIPGALVTFLILLPFLDRNPSRRISKRPWVMGITALSIVGAVGLSLFSQFAIMKEEADAKGKVAAAPPPISAPAGGTPASSAAKGAAIFAQNCSGCHGAAGLGQASIFPPLAKNAVVTGDKSKLVGILLNGLNGPVDVNGTKFNGSMPAWKGQLSNADIAAVATYIRASWGNSASPVAETDVTAAASGK